MKTSFPHYTRHPGESRDPSNQVTGESRGTRTGPAMGPGFRRDDEINGET